MSTIPYIATFTLSDPSASPAFLTHKSSPNGTYDSGAWQVPLVLVTVVVIIIAISALYAFVLERCSRPQYPQNEEGRSDPSQVTFTETERNNFVSQEGEVEAFDNVDLEKGEAPMQGEANGAGKNKERIGRLSEINMHQGRVDHGSGELFRDVEDCLRSGYWRIMVIVSHVDDL